MKYPVFVQALALTIVVLIVGLYAGMSLEGSKLDNMNDYYIQSEVTLMDILAFNNLVDSEDVDCETLIRINYDFMNRAYEEASVLEEYEESGRLKENLDTFHKKYDVLRTFLWINILKTKEVCEDNEIHTIVYLYNYEEDDLTKKATQNVWSKVLQDVKEEKGESLFLIPIARDTDLGSLEALISKFEIGNYPAIIVNEDYVFTENVTKDNILALLE